MWAWLSLRREGISERKTCCFRFDACRTPRVRRVSRESRAASSSKQSASVRSTPRQLAPPNLLSALMPSLTAGSGRAAQGR